MGEIDISHLGKNNGNPNLVCEKIARKFTQCYYSKTCVKQPLSKISKLVFKTNYRLMQV